MLNVSNRNFGLDLIRTIAITLVVTSHCTFIAPEFNKSITDGLRLLGATGVDIFFVLSGYLIGGIILKTLQKGKTKAVDLYHFWKRRWLRTLPNYFVILFINIGLLLLLDGVIIKDTWRYFLFVQNFVSPHPDFFTEAWSLSIEEYAYLILPALIFFWFSLIKTNKVKSVFLGATVFVIAILIVIKAHFYFNSDIANYKDWSASFRKVVVYRLDTIYYGFILVYFKTYYRFLKKLRTKLFLLGIIIFCGLHVLIVTSNILPQDYALFYSIFYLPLISISISLLFPWFIEIKASLFWVRVITFISQRSYAIYLVNYSIVLLYLQRYFQPSIFLVVLFLVITLVLSEVLYRMVERPFLKIRERNFPK